MATAAIAVIGQVALEALKLCNKCCKKNKEETDKEDEEEEEVENSEEEEESNNDTKEKEINSADEKEKEDITKNGKTEKSEKSGNEKKGKVETVPSTQKKRKIKKKRSKDLPEEQRLVTTQPVTIQTTVNPVFVNHVVPYHGNPAVPGASYGLPPGVPQWVQPVPSTSNHAEPPKRPQSIVEWVPSNIDDAYKLVDRAIVGGYDIDNSDLWVIRARFRCEVIPGKLNQHHKLGFVAFKEDETFVERNVETFEVLCIDPELREKIRWTKCTNGDVPMNAIEGGRKSSEEKLYIGRVVQKDEKYKKRHSLCPGMIQPSHGVLYVTYDFKVYAHKFYEVLCID